MQLTCWGAAGEVTGSQHLVRTAEQTLLLDCGLFQSSDWLLQTRNYGFSYSASDVDAVFLSHAHIDHCGNLPALVRRGFGGPIYCTPITAQLTSLMLEDGYRILEETTRRQLAAHPGIAAEEEPPGERLAAALPYSLADVHSTLELLEPIEPDVDHELSDYLRVRLLAAGHIPGAAIVQLDVEERAGEQRLIYSGDLGRRETVSGPAPQPVGHCDVLICEATYAHQRHPTLATAIEQLATAVSATVSRGGRVVIPAFSLGRAQQLLQILTALRRDSRIPSIPVFVDSPLASRVQQVLNSFAPQPAGDGRDLGGSTFGSQDLLESATGSEADEVSEYISSVQQSCALNDRSDPFVVISASGMCEAGRVQHHLRHALPDRKHSVVFVGYQATGTLGRRLTEGAERVRIHERDVPVAAELHHIHGLSAHADRSDLEWWLDGIGSAGGATHAFAVHGEAEGLQALSELMHTIVNEAAIIAVRGEAYDL